MSNEVHHPPKDHFRILLEKIHEMLTETTEIRENCVFLPKWNMTIRPEIEQLEGRMAVLNFYVYMPEWDEPLFECCASTGNDSETAFGISITQFVFCFMNGVLAMLNDEDPEPLESEFAGKNHRWGVYTSNSIGLGESTPPESDDIWNMLRDHIVKRLGNQSVTYVKVYASKCIGKDDEQVIGEVRINDIPSQELGDMMAEIAKNWNVEQFASKKQFFFIKQDPETKLSNRYAGASGRAEFASKIKEALERFLNVNTQDDYDYYQNNLGSIIGDDTLAEEIIHFLPEAAAEDAFSEIKYAEDIRISVGGAEPVNVYKNQLTDYYPLVKIFFSMLGSNVFGEQTNEMYRMLVGNSSIYNCVEQMSEKGVEDLSKCVMTSLTFNPSEKFEIR